MAEFSDWRLLREYLTAQGLLQTDLTDEPIDAALVVASSEFIRAQNLDGALPPDWETFDNEQVAILAIQIMARTNLAYTGELDGLAGPATRHALEVLEYRLSNSGDMANPADDVSYANPETRRTVMSAQARAKEPASIRYCNPGAMYPGPSATKFGSTRYEVIGGGHLIAVFDDDLHGAAAQFDLLYTKYTGLTIRQAITKWCGNNAAAAYTKRVCQETGLTPDTVLTKDMVRDPAIAIPFCRAAAHVEAGKPYPMDDLEWQAAHQYVFLGSPTDQPLGGAVPSAVAAPVRQRDAARAAVTRSSPWPRQPDVPVFYGRVGENQVALQLPYPLRIAWQQEKSVNSISVHELVASSARRVFEQVLQEYGLDEIRRLRLDLFGGSLNVRKMRGGSAYSMHSWGIAIDFDPDRNRMEWGRDKAAFARPEYSRWWEIWEAEGWVSLGRARNFDWMHVQAARL